MSTAQDLQISLVLRESPKAMAIGIASSWLLAAGMWEGNRTPEYALRAFGWAVVISAVLARGAWLAHRTRTPADTYELSVRSQRVQRNALALSFLWGSSSFAMLSGSDLERQMLLVAAIALITMGGAVGRAVHVPRVQLFVMITSVVFASGLLSTPGRFQLFIGLGYLLFGSVIALFCGAQENTVRCEREMNLAIDLMLREAERASARADAARQEAERANAAKTRFLATASHDLRQPMHSIGLLIGLIHDRSADADTKHLGAKAAEAVYRMERLFGSLLDLSKLDAGAINPKFETLQLDALLSNIDRVFSVDAEARGLILRVRPAHWRVRTDPVLLERILNNLVANALAHTRSGGVLVACRRRGDGVSLQVWDTGVGIAAEHQTAIFEEFYRIPEPDGFGGNRSEDRGLGLGLSIVQRSAEILHHPLHLKSVLGRGSRFEVLVPLAFQPSSKNALAPAPSRMALRGCFVVVVDDDQLNREAIAELFRDQGCLVLACADADGLMKELVEHLRVPELIVFDYRLGNARTAEELVRQIWERCEEDVPVLMVTADSSAVSATWAAKLGVSLVMKPAGPDTLLEAATRALAVNFTPFPPPEPAAEAAPPEAANLASISSKSLS